MSGIQVCAAFRFLVLNVSSLTPLVAQLPTQRSATPFCQALWIEVRVPTNCHGSNRRRYFPFRRDRRSEFGRGLEENIRGDLKSNKLFTNC